MPPVNPLRIKRAVRAEVNIDMHVPIFMADAAAIVLALVADILEIIRDLAQTIEVSSP